MIEKTKCESCNGEWPGAIVERKDNFATYYICLNCEVRLATLDLRPDQFFNLLKNGHTTEEYMLHGDFYDDETGKALQPMRW